MKTMIQVRAMQAIKHITSMRAIKYMGPILEVRAI